MRVFRKTIFYLLTLCPVLFSQDTTVYIIIDEPVSALPQNFRKCDGGFIREYDKMPDTTGLFGLRSSGSAEFGVLNFPAIIKDIGERKITVVDLRQETHFLVNGITISWYGQYDWADVGLTMDQVLSLEKKRMDSVRNAGSVRVIRVIKKDKGAGLFTKVKDTILVAESVISEEELVKSKGSGYFRITVTDRRMPTVADSDRFIEFINALPPEVWLHFHCQFTRGYKFKRR
jgi:hypothetical protein